MKPTILTFALLLLSIVSTKAATIELGHIVYNYEDTTYTMETDSIQLHSFSKADLFFRIQGDSTWIPVGRHAKNLKQYVNSNPAAKREFKRYQRRHFLGTSISLAGGILFVPMVFVATPIGAAAITGTTSTTGMLFSRNAEKHLTNSLEIMNKEILKYQNAQEEVVSLK